VAGIGEMTPPKQNPFSLYDFLGYLLPGAFFIYVVATVRAWLSANETLRDVLHKHLNLAEPERILPFLILAYLLGHLLSFLSSITVERYSIWQYGYPSKYLVGMGYPGYFMVDAPKFPRIVLRLFIFVLLLPISVPDVILGRFLRMRYLYAKGLDKPLVDILRKKLDFLVEHHCGHLGTVPAKDTDFFRLVYHYVLEHAPAHVPKMQNYVALYGFLRTQCFLFVVSWWLVKALTGVGRLPTSRANAVLGLMALVAYVLFMAFVKFYRRFSLEALMALVAVCPEGDDAKHDRDVQPPTGSHEPGKESPSGTRRG